MTAKRNPPRNPRGARRGSATLSGLPATGPLTLDEARAVVEVAGDRRRKLTSRSAGRTTAARRSPTPDTATGITVLGAERRRVRLERAKEDRERIREYRATLAVLQRRGVRRPGTELLAGAAAASFVPLKVLAEGDSWFDYPGHPIEGGVIPRLQRLLGVPILNLARAGDEVRYMLGVRERKEMIGRLTRGCPTGGPWDALLFSGGGNDIVGDPLVLLLHDFDADSSPDSLIDGRRLDAALTLIRAGYEDLIGLRDRLTPDTHLFFHVYDFAIPDGRGICHFGPWLQPSFLQRGFPRPDLNRRIAVTRVLLERFAELLVTLCAGRSRVTVVPTQGTLPPVPGSWHNELHPSRAGFASVAQLFRQEIREAFPDRVN